MTYQFTYLYATDTWHLGYTPNSPIGYSEPEYALPGVVPAGDWTLYAEMYGTSDGAAVGLVVEMEDGSRIASLGTWNWPLGYSEEGGENTYVHKSSTNIELRIEYHSIESELHLFVRSASTQGVWQSVAVRSVATPVDTGLLLRYADEGVDAFGYLTGVALLEGLESPDGQTDLQLAPTQFSQTPVVQPSLTLGNEPTVYALMGAPFGDLEFDVGKSARWLEYFSDKMFVLDVNLGDPRYWIVNWAMTFPDAEHAVTNINFFDRPADFRKEQFRLADKQYHITDDAWVLFVDASEGLSFDNSSLPDDYDFHPFMSFIYREIARAEAASEDSVVFPFFVFLRSDEVQNVTYDHRANMDDGSFSLLQPVSVPYYEPYLGLPRMFLASVLRQPDFDWASLDQAQPAVGPPMTEDADKYFWTGLPISPDETIFTAVGTDADDVTDTTQVAIARTDGDFVDRLALIMSLRAGDTLQIRENVAPFNFVSFTVQGAPTHDGANWGNPVMVPAWYNQGVEPAESAPVTIHFDIRQPPSGVKAQVVSYAYAHWNIQDIPPGATEPPALSEANDDGFRMRKRISKVRPIPSLPADGAWDPAADPAGVPGPWAKFITTNTDPSFEPITDTPVTDPDALTEGIKTPLYDCVIRLNMRDGVWYEGDVSGNTPMMWDSINGKWQTSYDPNTWPDLGVRAGDNPMYNDPQSPIPPVPTGP